MSEQNIAFGKAIKLANECGFKQQPTSMRLNCDLYQLQAFYQAATAEANKRIEALESEVAESDFVIKQTTTLLAEICLILKGEPPAKTLYGYHDLPKMVREIQANNHDLREALEYIVISGENSIDADDKEQMYAEISLNYIREGRKILSTTPAESLAKHAATALVSNGLAMITWQPKDMGLPDGIYDLYARIK